MSLETIAWLAVALGLLALALSACGLVCIFRRQGTWELTSASAGAAVRAANRAHESATITKGAVDTLVGMLSPPRLPAPPAEDPTPAAAAEPEISAPPPEPAPPASASKSIDPVQFPVPDVAPGADWEGRLALMHGRMDALLTLQERLAAAALAPPAPLVLNPLSAAPAQTAAPAAPLVALLPVTATATATPA